MANLFWGERLVNAFDAAPNFSNHREEKTDFLFRRLGH